MLRASDGERIGKAGHIRDVNCVRGMKINKFDAKLSQMPVAFENVIIRRPPVNIQMQSSIDLILDILNRNCYRRAVDCAFWPNDVWSVWDRALVTKIKCKIPPHGIGSSPVVDASYRILGWSSSAVFPFGPKGKVSDPFIIVVVNKTTSRLETAKVGICPLASYATLIRHVSECRWKLYGYCAIRPLLCPVRSHGLHPVQQLHKQRIWQNTLWPCLPSLI